MPLLIAFRLGRRPANQRYTYGYHRAEDLAGLAIVGLIAASAVFAAAEAIDRLRHPAAARSRRVVLAAGVIGFLGNEAVSSTGSAWAKAIGSAALVADGQHARTDGLTSLGVVAGAIGVLPGSRAADADRGPVDRGGDRLHAVPPSRTVLHRALDGTDGAHDRLIEASAAAVGRRRARLGRAGALERATGSCASSPSTSRRPQVRRATRSPSGPRRRSCNDVPRLADATVHVDPHEHEPHLPS